MNAKRYRVIQWATGNTGQRALREVIRHPQMDLVGVKVYDPKKDGVDAGDLCGEAPTGIKASIDRAKVLAIPADCVIYMPRATGSGKTRAGISLDELVEDVVAMAEAGKNIITTCTDLFAGGHRLSPEQRTRVLAACKKGNASIYPTATDPGYMTDVIPYALLTLQRNVECLEIEEFGDLSRRPSAHMIFNQMKFGTPLAEFDMEHRRQHIFGEFSPPVGMIADAAGFKVEEFTCKAEVAVASKDTPIVAGLIKAGSVAATRITVAARSGGREVVRLIIYAYVARDVEPQWDLRPPGWHLRVWGDAPLDVSINFPIKVEELGTYIPAYNANRAVNAVPYLSKAPPGLLTAEELPPILPRGPREGLYAAKA